MLITGPTDAATNFSVLFHIHAGVDPRIVAYPIIPDTTIGYLLQTIILEPQSVDLENDTRAVWVELQPSRLGNVSLRLQEQQTTTLVLNVSYHTYSAVAYLNVTFLPRPTTQSPTEDQSGLIGGLSTLMVVLLMTVTAVCVLALLSFVYRRQLQRRVSSKHIQLHLVESPESRMRRKILKEVRHMSSPHMEGRVTFS